MKLLYAAALLALLWFHSNAQGQIRTTQTRIDRTSAGELRVVPDPNSKYFCLMELAGDPSLQRFLELDDVTVGILSELPQKLKEPEAETMAIARKNRESVGEALMKFREVAAGEFFDEILTPSHQVLIGKLIYRLEIQRMGLAEAITSGRLSHDVGVHDEQKEFLMRTAKKIELEAREKIRAIQLEAEKELFSHLAPDQRKRAEELTSGTADYREPTRYQSAFAQVKAEIETGGDPFSVQVNPKPDTGAHH